MLWNWAAFIGGSSGLCVDPQRLLQEGIDLHPHRCIMFSKDSLGTNNVIERDLVVRALGCRDSEKEFPIFTMNCLAHQLVLSMKPNMALIIDLSGSLVRLGHLFESGRVAEKFSAELNKLVDRATFHAVPRLPPEALGWQAKSTRLFARCRASRDIKGDDE